MQIYSLSDKENGPRLTDEIPTGASLVLGFFDGVHRGHAALIGTAKEFARWNKLPTVVWTFPSMPKAEHVIMTPDERLSALAKLGVSHVIFEEFDDIRSLSPDEFFDDYLVAKLAPAAVFCGFNFRYGKGGAGTADSLAKSAKAHGIHSFALSPYEFGGSLLSSSRIRALISDGAVDEAAKLLTRPYSVTGEVIHGKEIGRQLGFPTVNLRIPREKITPAFGVYAATVTLDGQKYCGVCNVGIRPTVNSDASDVTLETNLLGYSGDAYGRIVTVELDAMLRPEKRFSSRDELSEQIAHDKESARLYYEQKRK